jgi:hypothetical protein
MKKNQTPGKKPGLSKTDTHSDYTDSPEDCIDGDCFDGPNNDQRTFIEPCHDCDPLSLPSEASREGQLLVDLALGRFVSNQSHYENSIRLNDHDGRKALSVLRKYHGIKLEWFYVPSGRGARTHRIIPHCLPHIHKAIKNVWGRDIAAANRNAATALAAAAKKPSIKRKGTRR